MLGKPMLDGKRHNWVTNTFYCKYEVNLCNIHPNDFWYFPQVSEDSKSDNNNDFKICWATSCSRTILDSAKQAKWNLWN